MKLANKQTLETDAAQCQIHLPYGLIGLPELRQFDLTPIPGSWPLLALKSTGNEEMRFAVIEPHTLIAGYDLEINDEDAELLQLRAAEDALIYNLVTIQSLQPQYVTVNLVGPIVVNRQTLIGKQMIIANFDRYSAQHVLIDERPQAQAI